MSSFTPENDAFTRRAHREALHKIYPRFLPEDYVLIDLFGSERDYLDDEDYEARVFKDGLERPVSLSVQERFRRMQFSDYREVTIAASYGDLQLHLSDSAADLLVYGYYDDETGELGETVVVSVSDLKYGLANGDIDYEMQQHGSKKHRFACLPFDDLIDSGACVLHADPRLEHGPIESYTRGEDIRQYKDTAYWVTRDGHVWREGYGWKSEEDRSGYMVLKLKIDGRQISERVHRAVARAFHGPPPTEDHQVHHKNEKKYDNRAQNLEWVTPKENIRASISKNLPIKEIRERYREEDISQKDLGQEYEVSKTHISRIIRGASYEEMPGPIKGEDY